MTYRPMPQPETYGTPPPWDKKSSGQVGDGVSSQDPGDVVEVARTVAAHGGGAASFDLALDLVLNEVVEQARLATGATGAAIALARAGEMVCRATTGADAPDLGVRLETTSGLSGACLQTGMIQQCGDTETDPRVNAEACRRLSVRSILVLPLGGGKDPFGVLEVFSSRPNVFGDREVNTLQVLARRVEESKRGAEVAAVLPSVDEKSHTPSNQLGPPLDYEQLWQPDAKSPIEEGSPRRTGVWTSILGVLVIVLAVLLGLALGWRAATSRGLREGSQARAGAASPTKANRETDSGGEHASTAAPAAEVAGSTKSGAVSQPRTSSAGTSAEPPSGGLLVTQNGKVIYRLPPAEQRAATGTSASPEGSKDVSTTRLIHRVEPQYPAEARAQHIQGLVALDVQIGGDGAVHDIAVVEGEPVLAEAAVQAVRQWRYRPYSVDGRPVEMQTRITIRFTLPPT